MLAPLVLYGGSPVLLPICSSIVDSPAPAAVPPRENNSPAEPAETITSVPLEPASETEQSTEPESNSDESVSSWLCSTVGSSQDDRQSCASTVGSSQDDRQSCASTVTGIGDAQSTEPEKKLEGNVPISVLLARAKEAYEIRQQKGNGWEREKTLRAVRKMEKAVLPDESIHPRDLEQVGIMEFDYVLELGVFLKPDV